MLKPNAGMWFFFIFEAMPKNNNHFSWTEKKHYTLICHRMGSMLFMDSLDLSNSKCNDASILRCHSLTCHANAYNMHADVLVNGKYHKCSGMPSYIAQNAFHFITFDQFKCYLPVRRQHLDRTGHTVNNKCIVAAAATAAIFSLNPFLPKQTLRVMCCGIHIMQPR